MSGLRHQATSLGGKRITLKVADNFFSESAMTSKGYLARECHCEMTTEHLHIGAFAHWCFWNKLKLLATIPATLMACRMSMQLAGNFKGFSPCNKPVSLMPQHKDMKSKRSAFCHPKRTSHPSRTGPSKENTVDQPRPLSSLSTVRSGEKSHPFANRGCERRTHAGPRVNATVRCMRLTPPR